ncbi:hypothetical protein KFU94_47090 [Chloroflexi bacterium TSY]|nr:hypothetical protein [Chloroflexi bacterium TSY]
MTDPNNSHNTLSTGDLIVNEANVTPDQFGVVLNTSPTAGNVLVTISTDGQCMINPITLTFTVANFDTPQVVNVVAVGDDVDESEAHDCAITLSTTNSSDAVYATLDDTTVESIVADDDASGVALTDPDNGNRPLFDDVLIVDEADFETTDLFEVALTSEPTEGDVTVSLSTDAQCVVSPRILSFTADDFNARQSVTVTVENDTTAETELHSCVMTLSLSDSVDPVYAALPDVTVRVNVRDDDGASVFRNCDTVSEIPTQECEALVKLHALTDGANWSNNSGWLDAPDICRWNGVICVGGRVAQLELLSNQLNGSLPCELGNLSELVRLNLSNNQISGQFPCELDALSKLEHLDLSDNQINSSLPEELGMLTSLISLNLAGNQLNGPIPPPWVALSALGSLDLGYNKLMASGDELNTFLNSMDPDWLETQTIAPTNMQAISLSTTEIVLSWDPIAYTEDDGYYEILMATTAAGPFKVVGQTSDKSATSTKRHR